MKNREYSVSPLRPEPEGFAGRVARTACSLCKGSCCENGNNHAFLDEGRIARVRRARLALDGRAVLRLYVERVPEVGYKDCAYSTESKAVRWTDHCGPMCAIATSVVGSRFT